MLLFSCKKEDPDSLIEDNAPTYAAPNDYTNYAVGNYWVYEILRCDSLGNNCQVSPDTDSVYVSKDTMIDNKQYFKIEGTTLGRKLTFFRRDSAHFSIDQNGRKYFSTVLDQNVFRNYAYVDRNDTLYLQKLYMDTSENLIQVKAGSFNCYTLIADIFLPEEDFEIAHPIYSHYSKEVGLIKTIHFYISRLNMVKRKLLGYQVD